MENGKVSPSEEEGRRERGRGRGMNETTVSPIHVFVSVFPKEHRY